MMLRVLLARLSRRHNLIEIVAVVMVTVVAALLRLTTVDFRMSVGNLDNDALYYYYTPARNFVEGRGFFQNDFDINAPLQGLFFAANMLIPGPLDVVAMQLFQVAISLIGLLAAWVWTRQLAGRGVAILFLLLLSINSELIARTPILVTENNYVALFFVAMALYQKFLSAPKWTGAVVGGLALGVCCLQRFNPLLLSLPLAGFILVCNSGTCWRRRLMFSGIFLISFAIPIAIWTFRNQHVFGHPIPTISQAGSILHFGNHVSLDNAKTPYFEDYFYDFRWMDESIERLGRTVQYAAPFAARIAYDKLYQAKFIQYVKAHPIHFLRNYFIRFGRQFTTPAPDFKSVQMPLSKISYMAGALSVLLIIPGLLLYTWKNYDRVAVLSVLIVFAYFSYFGALFHLTKDGRMNLLLRSLVYFWTAYVIVEFTRFAIARARSRWNMDITGA